MIDKVLPIFLPIVAGLIYSYFTDNDEVIERIVSNLAYFVFGPFLVFSAVYALQLDQVFNWWAFCAFLAGTVTAAITVASAEAMMRRSVQMVTARSIAASFGNTIFFGIPLAVAFVGPAAAAPAAVIAVSSNMILIPLFTTLMLATRSDRQLGPRQALASGLAGLKSPLVWPMFLAFGLRAVDLNLPEPVAVAASTFGAAAAPVALVGVGLFMRPALNVVFDRRQAIQAPSAILSLCIMTAAKLLIAPVTAWAIVRMADVDPLWAKASIIAAATPTAVVAHLIIAKNTDDAVAKLGVVATTTALIPVSFVLAALVSF